VRSAGGFTLVEVLVALLVLAVGIVGASATQLAAQRARRHAAQVEGAVRLATSLAERMRANPVVMAAADADNPYLQLDYDAATGAPAPAQACFGATDCSPAQMAGFDLYETTEALHALLPRGRIVVCRDAAWKAWPCTPGAGAPVLVKVGLDGDQAPSVALVVPG
jgi:type IV pilus assembly protein PilV